MSYSTVTSGQPEGTSLSGAKKWLSYCLAVSLFFGAAASALPITGGITVLPMAPGDSTPFVIRVAAQELEPDSSYQYHVWVYGGYPSPGAISQRWKDGEWCSGYPYSAFLPDAQGNWSSWVFLRIVKQPDPAYDYYIKYKLTSEFGDTLEVKVEHSQGFQILDMDSVGGWLEGIVYSDSGCHNPYENVVLLAKGPSDSFVGGYESEENEVEEGNPNEPGYLCIGVRAGETVGFDCRDLLGDSVAGYFEKPTPWWVEPGETTFVSVTYDLSVLSPIAFTPEQPNQGEELSVLAGVLNRGNAAASDFMVFSFADRNYNRQADPGEEIDSDTIGWLAPQETLHVSLHWTDIPEGIHSIFVQVQLEEDEHPENDKVSRSIRVGNPLGDFVLNEILYHPLTGQPEWIEVYNRSSFQIELTEWSIEDEDTLNPKAFSLVPIPSQGFFVLVSDTSSFKIHYPHLFCPRITPEGGLPSLNDAGDLLILRDSDGVLIDMVAYDPEWGGGSGISLERVNPNLPSNDPSNWGSCVSYKGGTPGEPNSIYIEVIPQKESLYCCPKVFSPDGDGVDDRVAISYELPFPKAKVRLIIYDRVGRRANVLLDQEDSGARATVFWDGRGTDGSLLPVGIYIVYLEAAYERNIITSKKTLVLAKRLR